MKRSFCLLALALIVLLPRFSNSSAHADTYKSAIPGPLDSNDIFIYGIDDSGDFVLDRHNCDPHGDSCYSLYVSGQQVSTSFTIPSLAYDNGVNCGVGYMGSEEICNNGREAFVAQGPGFTPAVLYSGTPSNLSVVKSGSFGFGDPVMNSKGDILFDDGNNFEEYLDVTSRISVTPEPSSIALFGTGVLALAGMARRKYRFG